MRHPDADTLPSQPSSRTPSGPITVRRSHLGWIRLLLVFGTLSAEPTETRTHQVDLKAIRKDLGQSLLGANVQQFRSHYSLRDILAQGPAFAGFMKEIGSPVLRLDGRNVYGWLSLAEHRALAGIKADALWFSMEAIHAFCTSNDLQIIGSFRDEKYLDEQTGAAVEFRNRPEHFDRAVQDNMKKLKWVLEHGYRDRYVAWEIGNECYATWDPLLYGQFARKMVAEARRLDPGIRLAVPVILRNTDDPAIAKFIAADPNRKNWFSWHDAMLPALGDQLPHITHLQIHIYGAGSAFSCNHRGLETIGAILEKIPGTRHLRYLVTEWRYTGVGGVQHRTFRTGALWNGKFAMTLLSHPRVDWTAAHEFLCTSGLGYWSPGDEWIFQYPQEGQTGKAPRIPNPTGKAALDVGPFGPVTRMLNEIVREYPLLLDHGADLGPMSSALFADGFKEPGLPDASRDLEWFVCRSRDGGRIGGFVVNTLAHAVTWSLESGSRRLQFTRSEQMTCPPDRLQESERPGAPKFWTVSRGLGPSNTLTLPPMSLTQFHGSW